MATILVAEDEARIRSFVRTILERAGHVVQEAEDGGAAYGLIRAQQGRLDLLITDIVMPNLDGTALARRVRSEYPAIKVLYISGYTDPLPADYPILAKPFTASALVELAGKLLDGAMNPDQRFQAESDVRARLATARLSLRAANEEYTRLQEITADAENADGLVALKRAMTLRNAAFAAYSEALRQFSDLIADNQLLRRSRRQGK